MAMKFIRARMVAKGKGKAYIGAVGVRVFVRGTMRRMAAFRCDLAELVFGKVGEVCGVGGGHFGGMLGGYGGVK